ncbi:hypothetical protein [Profundibacter sp.]
MKNFDLILDQKKRRAQVVRFLTIYCRKSRMRQFDDMGLPSEAIDELGREVVDFFEDRFEYWQKETPPKMGAKSNSNPQFQRGRRCI